MEAKLNKIKSSFVVALGAAANTILKSSFTDRLI